MAFFSKTLLRWKPYATFIVLFTYYSAQYDQSVGCCLWLYARLVACWPVAGPKPNKHAHCTPGSVSATVLLPRALGYLEGGATSWYSLPPNLAGKSHKGWALLLQLVPLQTSSPAAQYTLILLGYFSVKIWNTRS